MNSLSVDFEETSAFCPYFHRAAELIGRRWTGAILRALMSGLCHFNEIKAAIPDLNPRMLSERLKELEAEGIIQRTVIPDTPVRTEYHLTEKGQALEPIFDLIGAWAHDWLAGDAAITLNDHRGQAEVPGGIGCEGSE